jgi:hypothetical protein
MAFCTGRQKSGNGQFLYLNLADLKSAAVGVIWFVRSGKLSGETRRFFVLVKFAMPKQTQSAPLRTIAVIEPLHC